MKFFLKGLYFITDRTLSKKSVLEDVKAAIRGGASIIQYREKNLSDEQMTEEARLIAGLCKNNGVIFIINDRLEVVLACNADGIHLGPYDTDFLSARKTLGPGKIIGITVSSLEDAKRFEKLGADYVSLSPIFATSTKKDAGEPIGIDIIRKAKKVLKIPFTVIAGINFENIDKVLDAGAQSVCMISAIIANGNVEEDVRKAERIIHEHAA